MSPRAYLAAIAVAAIAVAVLGGPGVANAQGPSGPTGPTGPNIAIAASARGAAVSSVLTGQRWRVTGTISPAAAGERVELTATRDGAAVLQRSLAVSDGRFHAKLRITQPGQLVLTATAGGASSPPLQVAVDQPGDAQPGCGFVPEVVRTPSAHPARADDRALAPGVLLAPGASVVIPRRSRLVLSAHGAVYRLQPGRAAVACDALMLARGQAVVTTPPHRHAQVLLGHDLAVLHSSGRLHAIAPREIRYPVGTGYVVSAQAPLARVHTVPGDDVIIAADGLPRLTTWPFARLPDQRDARASDHLPEFWADGRSCSVGCRPGGARTGWPIKPFHQAHPLRSGLNEWRPANMHIGIDIQAKFHTPVYAIQSGRASIASRGTSDIHVAVGDYEYWHVFPSVGEGSFVHRGAVVGHIIFAARHLHLSEVRGGTYLNPLRPGGRVLKPWADHEPPIIGVPRRSGDTVYDEVFDPQSLRVTLGYRTPVLAPAAVAWRARNAAGQAISPLEFSYRGSQHYPASAKSVIYGPGTHEPDNPLVHSQGWLCFDDAVICIPRWNYRLAGVPASAAAISVYAWDWAGNESVLTRPLN